MKWLKSTLLLSILLVSACTSTLTDANTEQQESTSLIYTAAALTAAVSNTDGSPKTEQGPSVTDTPTSTNTPEYLTQVPVVADLLNLRSGPGTLFPVLLTLPRGSIVSTLGMIPDGTWVNVVATTDIGNPLMGWVLAEYLDLTSLKFSLPIEEWPQNSAVHGIITDTDGNPINAVRVAATTQIEGNLLRGEGTSDRQGEFFIYTPRDLIGPFQVEIVAVNCSSNLSKILSDGRCVVQDYFPVTWKTVVNLPLAEPIQFKYEQAAMSLEGKVVYQDGNGASQILIKATRQSDSVESEYVTLQGGSFQLPLGLGTWEIVAIRFLQDGTPLFSETRILEISSPGQVVEPIIIPYTEIIER